MILSLSVYAINVEFEIPQVAYFNPKWNTSQLHCPKHFKIHIKDMAQAISVYYFVDSTFREHVGA